MTRAKEKKRKWPAAEACSALAKPLAPEDVRPGDFVAVLQVICELPSFFWAADASMVPVDQPIRIPFVPPSSGLALRVKSVCLPFVLVKSARGSQRTLDLRQCRIARLDPKYAATTWKAYKRSRARKKNCRSRG